MVQTKRGLVFATSILSGIAAILSLVSIGTEQWVTSDGEFTLPGYENEPLSTIKYGLFYGTFFRRFGGQATYFEITMTCIIGENACALLCKANSEERQNELSQLLNKQSPNFDNSCPQVLRSVNGPYKDSSRDGLRAGNSDQFLNAGLYISTIFFLIISIIFGLVATGLSVWNTISSPYETYLSIYGLYIYNGIACCASIFVLCLWGAQFGSIIVDNVCILYTIRGQMNTQGLAYLGFSYWLILPTTLLYASSITILFTRQYLIEQEPTIKIHSTSGERDAGEIMIY